MGDEDFRLDRKHGGDFHSESSQIFAHFQLMSALATEPRWRFLQPFSGKTGGGLSFRFNLERNARSALRWGDGPRAVGFSMRCLIPDTKITADYVDFTDLPASRFESLLRLTGALASPG